MVIRSSKGIFHSPLVAKVFIFTTLAHFANDSTGLLFPLLIVYYAAGEHISLVFLGVLSVVKDLVSGLLSPLIGRAADTLNADPEMLGLGLLLQGIGVVLLALSFPYPSYVSIASGALVLGLGQAFYHPIGGAVLSRVFGTSAGKALGINGAVGSVGKALAPSLLTLITGLIGESLGLGAFASYLIASSILVKQGLSGYSRGSVVARRGERLELKGFLKPLLSLGLLVFLRSAFTIGSTTFAGEYAYQLFGSREVVGIFLSLGYLGTVLGQALFGLLTDRLGGRRTFQLSSLICVLSFASVLSLRSLYPALALYFLFDLSAFTAFPVLIGYVSQRFPKSFNAAANSYIYGVGVTVGGAFGNGLVTLLLGQGFTLPWALHLLLLLGGASFALSLFFS
jgi:MFS family permease